MGNSVVLGYVQIQAMTIKITTNYEIWKLIRWGGKF